MRKLFIALVAVITITQISNAQMLPPGGCPCIPEGGTTSYQTQIQTYFALGTTSMPGFAIISPIVEIEANATLDGGLFTQLNSYDISINLPGPANGQISITDQQMWIERYNPDVITWFVTFTFTSQNGNSESFMITQNITAGEFMNGPTVMY